MRSFPAVQAKHVSKSFTNGVDDEPVLSNVSFSIQQGEIVSLLGQSGCGKSTLLNVIGGFEQCSQGEVLIEGKLQNKPGRHCVMLFQEYGLLPWRTVLANVELGLDGLSLSKQEKRERAQHYIQLVGLQNKEGAFPSQLSGGMKQRTAIARALAMKPRLLLMDEPFAALDTFTRYALQDELLQMQSKEKLTIVLVTHDIDEAVYLSDRVFIMQPSPGRISAEIMIDTGKPLDRGHADFQYYRQKILAQFKLSGLRQEEEFAI